MRIFFLVASALSLSLITRRMSQPAASSRNRNVYTPAARRPEFPCPHCIRCCYSKAGLKNHLRARHGSQETASGNSDSRSSPVSASASDQLHSDFSSSPSHGPQNSDSEEEHPMDVDLDVQQPLAYPNAYAYDDDDGYDDHGYNSEFDMDLHASDHNLHSPTSSSGSESTLIIPSSPQAERESRPSKHQQTPANDRFLRRVYHDLLNGELIMHFVIPFFRKLCIISRSEMRSIWS
jgi:hypothetical protein